MAGKLTNGNFSLCQRRKTFGFRFLLSLIFECRAIACFTLCASVYPYYVIFIFSKLIHFLVHLRGHPIGMSVGGLAVINKSLALSVCQKNCVYHNFSLLREKKLQCLLRTSNEPDS